MPRAPHAATSSSRSSRMMIATLMGILAIGGSLAASPPASAQSSSQDWGSTEDDWSSSQSTPDSSSNRNDPATSGWSLRAGAGFTSDPDDFLLTFELPYRFDQYISAGPMMQIGLEDDRYIVAPTANLTITIPDMPGERLDKFHPLVSIGVGFAVIGNDDRGGDDKAAGFLVNTGFGFDYALSENVSLGSRMFLNFLPEETLEEKFWYSWEIGNVRVSF